MSDLNVVLAESASFGRVHLCSCKSIHLKIGPVTVCLAPEAFAQTAVMVRKAMEQLTQIMAAGPLEELRPTHPSSAELVH
jgi:hypothetical protein